MIQRGTSSRRSIRPARRGLTLLEAVLSIVVIAIVSAVITPVIAAATENYAAAAHAREAVDDVAQGLDRVVRLLRETPRHPEDDQRLGIASMSSSAIEMTDGRAVALSGGVLALTDETGRTGPVCRDVFEFDLQLIASDGVSSAPIDDANAHVFDVRLTAGGMELRTRVLPRVRLMGGG